MRSQLSAAGVVAWLFLATPAFAQSAEANQPNSAGPTDRVTYGPSFFASYDVSNVEDMLRLMPGGPAILEANTQDQILAAQQRGFGSGGARVLINGRRFPGKANDINTNLRRIPASSVDHIELISGTAQGISVQSQGILVNVVLREGASLAGSGSMETNLRFNDAGRMEADGLLAYNGVKGPLSYTVGLERNAWSPAGAAAARYSDRSRSEAFFYPAGKIQQLRPQDWRRSHSKWIYTGGATYDFANGDRLQLNALYQTLHVGQTDTTNFTPFDLIGNAGAPGVERHVSEIGGATILELGGEYQTRIGAGDLRTIFISRRADTPTLDFRNRDIAGARFEVSRNLIDVRTGEDVVRSSYTVPIARGQSLEVGMEAARNTLGQDVHMFLDTNGDARLEPVDDVRANVEELRGEVFATHRWTLNAAWSLESSLRYEASRLSSDFEPSRLTPHPPKIEDRSLGFLKPRFDLRYRASPATQYRFRLERTISQLDFNNFVPRFDQSDVLRPQVVAGNPQIVPEKTWIVELGYQHRLARDAGLIEARVFYNDITDSIDKVPLCRLASGAPAPGEACRTAGFNRLYSAAGNIPSATLYGVEVKASVRLDDLGLKDSLLSVTYLRQESEIEDPFAQLSRSVDPSRPIEKRRLLSDPGYTLNVAFRQDLKRWGVAYGFTYQRYGWTSITSDLQAREYYSIQPTLEAFVEKRLTRSTNVRLEVQNIINGEGKTRLLYAQNAVVNGFNGPLNRYETYSESRDRRFALRLRARF